MSGGITRVRFRKRKLGVLVVGGVILALLAWYVKNYVSLEELVVKEELIREAIDQRPLRSFGIGLAIYAVVSLVPCTSGKSIVFGWLFGFWQGVVIILVGLTAAATVNFNLSRYVFRGWIENRYGKYLNILNRHLKREGAFYLLTLRMAHAPFSLINLVSGASRIGTGTFCWTTALGLLPGTAVFAYVGYRIPSLEELAEEGAGSLMDWPLIGALILSAILPFIFRSVARKLGILKVYDSDIDDLTAS